MLQAVSAHTLAFATPLQLGGVYWALRKFAEFAQDNPIVATGLRKQAGQIETNPALKDIAQEQRQFADLAENTQPQKRGWVS